MIDATVAARIRTAACPEDLFGPGADDGTVAEDYRQLAKAVHPDRFATTPHHSAANELFVRLGALKGDALKKLAAKSYGDRAAAAPAGVPYAVDLQIDVKGKRYHLTKRLAQGDICDLYACEADGKPAVFKVVQTAADNDMVENEAKVLAHLYPNGQADDGYYRHLPRALDTFVFRSKKSDRRAVVLPWYPEHVSLAEVMRRRPDGLDYRDVVWMFKRMLCGLGLAHSKGVVHGAVLPPHVLIHPVDHGARLIDWCYAVQGAGHVKAISAAYRAFYPPEVMAKKPATPATDIYMAARCFVALTGGKGAVCPDSVPVQVRAFIGACLLEAPGKRPSNAWDLHDEFDQLLARVVGKRAYRKLDLG